MESGSEKIHPALKFLSANPGFNLLRAYSIPGTVLERTNQTGKDSAFVELTFQWVNEQSRSGQSETGALPLAPVRVLFCPYRLNFFFL